MATTTLAIPAQETNDLLTGAEWSPAHSRELLAITSDIKANPGRYAETLRGRFLALIFEKPSLRTRVTFEVGIQSMRQRSVRCIPTQCDPRHTATLQFISDARTWMPRTNTCGRRALKRRIRRPRRTECASFIYWIPMATGCACNGRHRSRCAPNGKNATVRAYCPPAAKVTSRRKADD